LTTTSQNLLYADRLTKIDDLLSNLTHRPDCIDRMRCESQDELYQGTDAKGAKLIQYVLEASFLVAALRFDLGDDLNC
uniref:Transcriptional regulator n=1 Tax=Anisakis simplex TaxID=6269 RepID=A0A0M3JE63_ANISI